MTEPIHIGLIDDHAIIHEGIAGWCAQADPPIVITGSYLSPASFYEGHHDVDVVVLDLQFDGRAPDLDALHRLSEDGYRVIVFSQHTGSSLVLECLDLGAVTYLSKAEGREHLIAAIHAARTDQPYLGPTMAKAMNSDEAVNRPMLSPREREVLISWFQTESQALVAKRLFITPGTVKTHLGRIRAKYAAAGRDAPTKAALVARAIQDGLITADDL
ncbi:response regulator transcription factor [Gordonia rhizosphera]|uniref:Putative two-component response regulator n=1 Tax=Gordonia rhizosphera NBRC 16068 TaxID=1108045 RepID=K6VVV9_9ACTN|nr:response regulator transcription factor [Gordonia rhizosphera]GAB91040.1 putative two-component response regulator [Gordonia rhizosphera NBRC 16068]